MTAATPSHHALARWLVHAESGNAAGAWAAQTAAERVFHKLRHRLARLITPAGSEALLVRAVHLSRAAFPFLEGIQLTFGAEAVTLSVRDSDASVGSDEDLTLRLLLEGWSDLPMAQAMQSILRNGTGKLEVNH